MMGRFDGSVAVVTGARRRPGPRIRANDCAEGAKVVVVDIDGDTARAGGRSRSHARRSP